MVWVRLGIWSEDGNMKNLRRIFRMVIVLRVRETSFLVELLPVVGFRLKYNDCLMMKIQNDRFITCFPTFG